MEFLQKYQLNIMLALAIICGLLSLFTFITNSISSRRKYSLLIMSVSAMFLLISDRFAYFYSGNTSTLGFWMVRITNFLVFFLILVIIYAFNNYLVDLFACEGNIENIPKRIRYVKFFIFAGVIMLIISQFTGIYYTFDANNIYQRSGGFIICYLFPLVVLFIQLSIIIQYRKNFSRRLLFPLLAFVLAPLVASIIQIFLYGISLTNMTSVGLVVLLYIFSILDTNKQLEIAHKHEVDLLKQEQENIRLFVSQTTSALVEAIDAKDKYTNGHSKRVAKYSVMIAEHAGKSQKECDDLYLIALLHDVGKIGIPDAIINKTSRLTNDEFAMIKNHTVIGKEILSKISISPKLSIGANYHHERYDGRGYPEGLKGKEIPEIARIIAVADTYDAMASKRSYRDTLPQQVVRNEMEKGIGTQFDPEFAKIMIQLIDSDTEYQLRQM